MRSDNWINVKKKLLMDTFDYDKGEPVNNEIYQFIKGFLDIFNPDNYGDLLGLERSKELFSNLLKYIEKEGGTPGYTIYDVLKKELSNCLCPQKSYEDTRFGDYVLRFQAVVRNYDKPTE